MSNCTTQKWCPQCEQILYQPTCFCLGSCDRHGDVCTRIIPDGLHDVREVGKSRPHAKIAYRNQWPLGWYELDDPKAAEWESCQPSHPTMTPDEVEAEWQGKRNREIMKERQQRQLESRTEIGCTRRRKHMNTALTDVLGQIKWAAGLAKTCKPFTPTEPEAAAAWAKMRNLGKLRWGCKLSIVFKEDADWALEEGMEVEVPDDIGYLIALPGQSCSEVSNGIVWVPHARAEKCEGDPVWMHLWVLLANPQVAWVEVLK